MASKLGRWEDEEPFGESRRRRDAGGGAHLDELSEGVGVEQLLVEGQVVGGAGSEEPVSPRTHAR